ncbi:MAG: hypothetical protein HZB40_10610 [Rhodocyclales bacterium]|nr:hypothetical protein [Rhodocyclales bacterium]
MSQVSAPVSTTVVASDIAGAAAFGAAVLERFEQVLAVVRGLGFVTQEPGRPNLTLTLAPDQEPGSALDAMAKAAAGFDAAVTPLSLRSVVHFGVVFRTESATGVSYVGSAIRTTQSALRRVPSAGGFLATAEFAVYAAKYPQLPFRMRPVTSGAAIDGLSHLLFGDIAADMAPASAVASGIADAAFVEFAKRRLAEEIGPFANALVDRAVRAATATDQLVSQLASDIDNPAARKKFEDDMLRFAKSRC